MVVIVPLAWGTQVIVALPELPLSITGKLNYRALPKVDPALLEQGGVGSSHAAEEYLAPATPLEAQLQQLFASVLKVCILVQALFTMLPTSCTMPQACGCRHILKASATLVTVLGQQQTGSHIVLWHILWLQVSPDALSCAASIFQLGADSFKAGILAMNIRQLGYQQCAVTNVFSHPSVQQLAALLRGQGTTGRDAAASIVKSYMDEDDLPSVPVRHRLMVFFHATAACGEAACTPSNADHKLHSVSLCGNG